MLLYVLGVGSNSNVSSSLSSSSLFVDITHAFVKRSIDEINSSTSQLHPEPPEDSQYKCHRIVLSLIIQLISRFYVIPVIIPGSGVLYSDASCSRQEMIRRIKSFSYFGGEALFGLYLTCDYSNNWGVTSGDKQFAIWTFREITVSAFEVNARQISSLMQWQIWLLRCPVRTETKIPSRKSPTNAGNAKGGGKSQGDANYVQTWGSANRVMLERELITLGKADDMTYAVIPSTTVSISCITRLCLLQEIKNLLAGDEWVPIISEQNRIISNKISAIPNVMSFSVEGKNSSASGMLFALI